MNLKQNTGLKRNVLDKFYTKEEIVKDLMILHEKYIEIDKNNDLIIEPSAGNGKFISMIKQKCNNSIFIDIQPEHNEIEKHDYLNYNLKNNRNYVPTEKIVSGNDYKKIHIIGNPPFGKNSSLAIKFIKHSCLLSHNIASISFILPKSFRKESMKKYFDLHFHLIFEKDLPNNSFLVNDTVYNVPCIFQIWKYKKDKRQILQNELPKSFKFVKKEEEHDISFRRVGVYAGKICIFPFTKDKSKQSHYFIKFINKKTKKENLDKLLDIDLDLKSIEKENLILCERFENNNTVGPRSISKPELIHEFNKHLD